MIAFLAFNTPTVILALHEAIYSDTFFVCFSFPLWAYFTAQVQYVLITLLAFFIRQLQLNKQVAHLSLVFNSSINMILYVALDARFRRRAMEMLCCRRRAKAELDSDGDGADDQIEMMSTPPTGCMEGGDLTTFVLD